MKGKATARLRLPPICALEVEDSPGAVDPCSLGAELLESEQASLQLLPPTLGDAVPIAST